MTYEKKKHLRREMRRHRLAYHGTVKQEEVNGRLLSFFRTLMIPTDRIIAGYMALEAELNITPLLETLFEEGYRVCLPVVIDPAQPLVFRQWSPGDLLINDSMGIPAPAPVAPAVDPDVLLVPLLAFDDQGNRLGQGMGHYDMTMAALSAKKPIMAIGMAYEAQKIAPMPTYPTDYPMDVIITDQKIHHITPKNL